jgi:hypothetical protein
VHTHTASTYYEYRKQRQQYTNDYMITTYQLDFLRECWPDQLALNASIGNRKEQHIQSTQTRYSASQILVDHSVTTQILSGQRELRESSIEQTVEIGKQLVATLSIIQ